jgi:hypothetical protein
MEAIIAVSIIGLGYLFQNNTEYNKKKKLSNTKSQKPNGPNIYTSNRAYEIFQNEQKQVHKQYFFINRSFDLLIF